jgi:hypothetical protein
MLQTGKGNGCQLTGSSHPSSKSILIFYLFYARLSSSLQILTMVMWLFLHRFCSGPLIFMNLQRKNNYFSALRPQPGYRDATEEGERLVTSVDIGVLTASCGGPNPPLDSLLQTKPNNRRQHILFQG